MMVLSKKLIFLSFSLLTSLQVFSQTGLIRFYDRAKVGYKNAEGKVVVIPKYDAGSEFINDFAIVVLNGKRGYLNSRGQLAIPLIYDDAAPFYSGLAQVSYKGTTGYIDTLNKWVCDHYTEAGSFSDGLAYVSINGKYGFINTNCEVIIPFNLDGAQAFSQGLAPVMQNGKWGYIDTKGKWKISPRYQYAATFTENKRAVVVLNSKKYEIDSKGNITKELLERKEND